MVKLSKLYEYESTTYQLYVHEYLVRPGARTTWMRLLLRLGLKQSSWPQLTAQTTSSAARLEQQEEEGLIRGELDRARENRVAGQEK